ncbi:UNVERIFIED_CONTAM: cytochrome [Sesamum latifolium]|uniref:Cytochrome n=1 Tax=Sesamum latifolium TaxID=2727402 RepID=A0AAW2WX09_9LAMI
MDQFYIAIISVLVMSILWFIKVLFNPVRRNPPLPPGPRGLPILGYLPFLGKNLLHQFRDLAHQYGPIYKLYLGNKLCVVINSPSLVKEVVRDQDAIFADRDANIAALTATYGGNDIAFSLHNSQWQAMRKIFVREVLSSSSLQASYNLRKDEVKKAIRYVYNNIGKPVQVGELSF